MLYMVWSCPRTRDERAMAEGGGQQLLWSWAEKVPCVYWSFCVTRAGFGQNEKDSELVLYLTT